VTLTKFRKKFAIGAKNFQNHRFLMPFFSKL